MQDFEIIAGAKGVNKIIKKFNVIEVPDIIDWVDAGEFLLTTGYTFRDNPEAFKKMVEDSITKNIAGIGIKMKRYLKELPEDVIKIANDADLPIISIPYHLSFSDILIVGFTGIVSTHAEVIYQIEEIQTQFIDVMLKGKNLNDIANVLFQNFHGNSIVIKNNVFDQTIVRCDPSHIDFVQMVLDGSNDSHYYTFQNRIEQRKVKRVFDEWDQQTVSRVIIPIYYGDKDYGSIYIWEDNQLLTPVEISTIESSTSLIALNIYDNISLKETESLHVSEFMQNLLSGKPNLFKEAMNRAYYFNFDCSLNYSIIVVTFFREEDMQMSINRNDFIKNRREMFLRAIQYMQTNSPKNNLGAVYNDDLVFLHSHNQNDSPSKVKRDIHLFINKLEYFFEREKLNNHNLVTIGSLAQKPEKLCETYDEAIRAIRVQKIFPDRNRIFYDEIGAYRLFTFDNIKKEGIQFCKETLGTLIEYDKRKNTDYINTLSQYFKCDGNYVKLAEKLFIHYNTAVYRIQRIMKISNLNVEDHYQRMELEIALLIYRLYYL